MKGEWKLFAVYMVAIIVSFVVGGVATYLGVLWSGGHL